MYQPGSLKYWQAKYERHLLATTKRSTARRAIAALENFMGRFKDRKTPDEIYVTDVEDYKVARKAKGLTTKTLAMEINTIRGFYYWLTDVQDVPTFNPALKSRKRVLAA